MNQSITESEPLAAKPAESVPLASEADERKREQYLFFVARLAGRKAKATWTILGVIAVVFGLEFLWGGVDSLPVLARMGALAREKLLDGEWWRPMSSGVLHGGVAHVLMNSYVLFALGNILERVIGTPRFLVLYVVSGLVAALGSAALQGNLSVGASGAIWGLLGAEAALAFGKSATIPDAFREQAKRGVVINLGINILNSFRPHVDWAAHFAGGAAGLVLTATVLLRGLPTLDAPLATERNKGTWKMVAIALTAVYFGGAAWGVVSGQAWQLRGTPEYVEQVLPDNSASVEVPRLLPAPVMESDGKRQSIVFGDKFGPLVIAITPVELSSEISVDTVDAEFAELRDQLSKVGPNQTIQRTPRTRKLGTKTVADARYDYKTGVDSEVLFITELGRLYRIEVVTWPGYEKQYAEVAERVVTSFKTPTAGWL